MLTTSNFTLNLHTKSEEDKVSIVEHWKIDDTYFEHS